ALGIGPNTLHALVKESLGRFGRYGLTEQEALALLASLRLQFGILRVAFDAFGDHRHSQAAAEADQSAHDFRALALHAHPINETAIDLDRVDLEVSEVIKARIAGAEVIQRNADTGIAE